MKKSLQEFILFMEEMNLSAHSVRAYSKSVSIFLSMFAEINADSLARFRQHLVSRHKPQTTNLRILAVNKYLSFSGFSHLKLSPIKIQHQTFAENVISLDEYLRIKNGLLAEQDYQWYFMVWIMGATGGRVGELLQIRVEDVLRGWVDILSKGNKSRRIYFPAAISRELVEWGMNGGICTGCLFLNNRGNPISSRGFAMHLKKLALRFNVNPAVVYPHSFRHMYAKNFLSKHNDLSLLADLLGHESLETTQIYLRCSSREQMQLLNAVVTW